MKEHTTHHHCACYEWNEDLKSIPKGELLLVRGYWAEEDHDVVFIGGLLPSAASRPDNPQYFWAYVGDGRMGTMLSMHITPKAWMYIPGIDYSK